MERLAQLREAMAAASLELLALVPGPNFRHLTGLQFHLSERPVILLVPRRRRPVLVLPELERSRAASLECDLFAYSDGDGPTAAFAAAAGALPAGRLGVEGRVMRFMCGHMLQGLTKFTSGTSEEMFDAIEHSVTSKTLGGLRSRT